MTVLAYFFYFVAATIAPIQRRCLSTKNDERVDAHGNILAMYETIAEKEGISSIEVQQLIERAIRDLAGGQDS